MLPGGATLIPYNRSARQRNLQTHRWFVGEPEGLLLYETNTCFQPSLVYCGSARRVRL